MTTTTAARSPRREADGAAAPRPAALLGAAVVVAVTVMALLLWVGDGRPVTAPDGLPDPGLGTQWAVPVLRVLGDLAAVLTVGLLLLGAVLVPARDGLLRGARLTWTRAARWSALVWSVVVLGQMLTSLSDIIALPLGEVLDPTLVWSFVSDVELGRALLVQLLLAVKALPGLRPVDPHDHRRRPAVPARARGDAAAHSGVARRHVRPAHPRRLEPHAARARGRGVGRRARGPRPLHERPATAAGRGAAVQPPRALVRGRPRPVGRRERLGAARVTRGPAEHVVRPGRCCSRWC